MPDTSNLSVLNGHNRDADIQDNLPTQLVNSSNLNQENPPSSNDWSYATKELLDTLPRVWTRGLLYFLVVFIGVALPWAMFSQVDETGTARGRLEPQGKTVKLDAPVAGTVAAIKVKEGESVKAGQSLLELESELVRAELQQQLQKFSGQQNRQNQLELLKNQLILAIRTQQLQNQAQKLEKQAQIDQARQNLDALKTVYYIQKDEKQAQVNQARQALNSSQVAYNLADISLRGSQEKYQRYRQAFKEGVISQDRFQEVEQLVKENSERLVQAQTDIAQAQLRLKEQERSDQSLTHSGELAVLKSSEQLKNLETQITTLSSDIAQSQSQIEALEFQLNQRVLATPIEGTVFQLPIQRAGAVVQPKDMIAEIAPLGSFLVLRAQMATAESGSLKKGMPVKMKFDAYPFQDYGVVEGELMEISPTSKVTETDQGQVATYDLEIELSRTCIPTPSECIALRPGDTATAEVIVRQRRVIDFILDPFKKLQQGGLEL